MYIHILYWNILYFIDFHIIIIFHCVFHPGFFPALYFGFVPVIPRYCGIHPPFCTWNKTESLVYFSNFNRMKKGCIIFFLAFTLALNAQKFPGGDLFYTVPFPVQVNNAIRAEWWHEYMDLPQHTAFFQSLLDLADSGRITAYSPEFPFAKALSAEEVQKILHKADTVYSDYAYLYTDADYFLVTHEITANNIVSVSFHEEWQYDSIAKTLRKNVKGIVLNARENENDPPQGAPLFYIRFDGKGISSGPAVMNPPAVILLTYDLHSRRQDEALFAGDSTMRMKLQAGAGMIIHSSINAKKNVFYDTLYPYNKPIDKKIIKSRLPGFQSANTMRFMEDWYVDLGKMTFTKNVHGIVLEKENESEQALGEGGERNKTVSFSRLAFLPLNGYVPSAFVPQQVIIPGFIYRENFFTNPIVRSDQTVFSDSAALMKMCTGICNLAENKKIRPYYYAAGSFYSGDKIKYTSAEIDSLFAHVHDKNLPAGLFDPDFYGETPFCYQKTGGLGFKESWVYDPQKNTFEKKVQSLSYLSTQLVNVQEANFMMPLFYLDLPPVTDTAKIMRPEFLVAKNIHAPVMIDHAWETDEEERRYNPQVFKNESAMDPSLRYHFVQQVIDNALAGKITVYDGTKPGLQLTSSQLQVKINSLKDSSFIKTDLSSDYLLFQEIIFVEDWYFNPATGEFYKKVNEIIFVNSDNFVDPYRIDFEKQDPVFAIKLN